MRTSRSLHVWLAAAVGIHLVVSVLAALAQVPETVAFYGLILAYAIPAAIGLALSGRLAPWRAVVWAVVVITVHGMAVSVTFAMTKPYGEHATVSVLPAGAAAGLIGAGLSLFGLIVLGGAKPSRRTLTLALGATVALSALGGVLCLLAMTWGLELLQAYTFAVALYLPWQIVFSLAVAGIAAPARRGA